MRIALVADTFPPQRTSGAVQLRDLSRELVRQGHDVTVMLPWADGTAAWSFHDDAGVEVMRLRAPRTKDIGYLRRTLAELAMPFTMRYVLRRSPLGSKRWDGVVWYSPSIFHGPLVAALKRASGCPAYLVIRDIFPEWAVDMGLMGRGPAYRFFRAVADYQYRVADTIGVQTEGNLGYFEHWARQPGRRLEVLQNWLAVAPSAGCGLRLRSTPLAGRKVLVYAGNMGVAQGVDILIELAERLRSRPDLGLLFVGRGSEATRLEAAARARGLDNVLFHDEIHPDEIPALYAQCAMGLLALDPRHRSHNIPGKFLTYMQGGLPVLASVNPGNDLAALIRSRDVGHVCEDGAADTLTQLALGLLDRIEADPALPVRCRALFAEKFAVDAAARQIVAALRAHPAHDPVRATAIPGGVS